MIARIRALIAAARKRLRRPGAALDDMPSGPYAGLGDVAVLYTGLALVAILLGLAFFGAVYLEGRETCTSHPAVFIGRVIKIAGC